MESGQSSLSVRPSGNDLSNHGVVVHTHLCIVAGVTLTDIFLSDDMPWTATYSIQSTCDKVWYAKNCISWS